MIHHFFKGQAHRPVYLLLHGTGGTEHDLIPLAKQLDAQASILTVRGEVQENGMSRFFKRIAEGVFDLEDLKLRTERLYVFIQEAAKQYQFSVEDVVLVGYSNGANIAANLLFEYGDVVRGAILHHPMVPQRGKVVPDLNEMPIFIGAGINDPLCSIQESEDLIQLLKEAGAEVHPHFENNGHTLTNTEVEAASQWVASQLKGEQ